ncbi:MAG TPA: heparan-alpha-glucosaminide N-acetyltransferase domain-containing protein [Dinghuibacter sp.]|jgi:predicted acyltransferase|uniref:acyltransferase family protein n=1 Tax=Dinghuibacter sp. TaxID=2024697 RepID=UPI002B944BDE|nr:heparan-alpha-glucosaminide N-acetyltransferase domain-containing protein [Dinghuibacter sp.]HTJ14983.1 heparan-alpha-glucosaminide N-acetyltransferase domain-containing protein [Dinghuibacter sp.]
MRERYYSLDVFRGATLVLMILVNNQAGRFVYTPLDHSPWNGCTPTDLVFPFFLFAMGNAFAFVLPRLEQAGRGAFWRKVVVRSFLIFLIGYLLNWSPFFEWKDDHLVFRSITQIRVMGVLQRLALCYLLGAFLLYYLKPKGAFVAVVTILLLYWWACFAFGTPGDPYSLQGYFGLRVDQAVFGDARMYHGEGVAFDPEGIMSTFPAVANMVFGYFVGHYIITKGKTYEMLSNLFVVGCVFTVLGLCWDLVFPINKKIWTSSYVLFTVGLAILTLSVMIFLVEFRGWRGAWTRFFDVFGKNPLFLYILSSFFPKLQRLIRWDDIDPVDGKPIHTGPLGWWYNHVCYPLSLPLDPRLSAVLYAVTLIALYWVVARWLDKRKVYIRV